MKLLISLLALSLIITACNIPPSSDYQYSGANGFFKSNTEAQEASIHTNFSKHFMIGTAVSAKQILGSDRSTLDLVKKEFNAVTPENVMKWAFAEMIQIPKEEQKNYPVPNTDGQFYAQRYDTDNQKIYDEFIYALAELNDRVKNEG